jgi:L-aspartate aminotransferase apoenzyme (EC 2.6.1.1)
VTTAGKGPGGPHWKSQNVSSIKPSAHLAEVRYEIRGALTRRARELEAAGKPIIKLNIGNPGRYGFTTPAHLREAIAGHLGESEAYGHEQGLEEAREAIVAQQRARGALGVDVEHVFIGNGVSELIDISLRALLQPGDEVLLPSPDYPLWSAATILNDGSPRYYRCLAENGHLPDPEEIEALVGPRTRALVLINPNNPTGAVYPRALLERIVEVARRHNLLLLCDEIYDEILYDGTPFQPLAAVAGDHPCVSFGGLSKVHRACGYRVGWMSLSGGKARIAEYRDALQLLAALRLCANVTAQWAVRPALLDKPTIGELTAPGGRLHEARRIILDNVAASPYLDVVAPGGAIYAFPWIRAEAIPHFDDTAFALRLLEEEEVLVVPGTSFNLHASRHLRLTLLPEPAQLAEVFTRMDRVLARMAAEDRPATSAVA